MGGEVCGSATGQTRRYQRGCGHLELSICRLASMSSLSAALMCAQLLPGAVSEPASTTVS